MKSFGYNVLAASLSRARYGAAPISPAASPVWVAQSAPAGTQGVSYSYQFVATNATSYTLGTGSLPAGLSLDGTSGILSGVPTTQTTYSFTILAINAAAPAGVASTGQSVTVGAASGNTITASIVPSVSSLTYPMGVLFDCTGVSTNVSQCNDATLGGTFWQTYHELTFGDSGSGNYGTTGASRNTQNGAPIAAHLYESGTTGSKTPQVKSYVGRPWATSTSQSPNYFKVGEVVRVDPLGGSSPNTYICAIAHTPGTFSTDLSNGRWTQLQTGEISDTKTTSISCTIADTTYPTTQTIFVAANADYSLAPSGSTKQTSMPAIASNRRIMVLGDANTSSYGDMSIGSGITDCLVIGVFSSARPKLSRVNTSGTRNKICNFQTSLGISGFTGTDNLAFNNIVAHSDSGAVTLYWSNDVNNDSYSQTVRPQMFRNTVVGNSNSIASMYGAGRSHMIVENTVGAAVQHTFRCFSAWKAVTAHNKFDNPVIDGSKLTHKQHAIGLVQWPTTSATGQYATEFLVVANNIFGSSTGTNAWIADVCSENFDATTVEGISDIIYENNVHVRPSGGSVSTDFLFNGRRIGMRGNSIASGAMTYGNVNNASGAGGVVGSTNSTYRNNWIEPHQGIN